MEHKERKLMECPRCSFPYNESGWRPEGVRVQKWLKALKNCAYNLCMIFQGIWYFCMRYRLKCKQFNISSAAALRSHWHLCIFREGILNWFSVNNELHFGLFFKKDCQMPLKSWNILHKTYELQCLQCESLFTIHFYFMEKSSMKILPNISI